MRYQHVITSWRFLYVATLIAWTLVICSNQIDNKDNWKKSFGNSTQLESSNWVHVGAGVGLGSGIVVLCVSLYAICWDRGDWATAGRPKGWMLRVLLEMACNIATLSVVGVASIYLYVHSTDAPTTADIDGIGYSVVLGGIFLAVAIVDSIFFRPSLTYIELMASPCFRPAVFNTRMNVADGTTRTCSSVYDAHLRTILGVLPFLGSFGDTSLDVNGIPLMFIMSGNYDSDQERHYRDAALELVRRIEQMYGMQEHGTRNPVSGGSV